MLKKIIAAMLEFLAWLLRKEEKNVAAIVFKGKTIPLADIESVTSALVRTAKGVSNGEDEKTILAAVGPMLLNVGEDVASMFIPGAGAAIEVVAWMLRNSRPMTQEETNAFMDRFGAGSQS